MLMSEVFVYVIQFVWAQGWTETRQCSVNEKTARPTPTEPLRGVHTRPACCHWQRPLALSSFVEEGERCWGLSLSVSSSLAREGARLAGRAVPNPLFARSAERGQDSVRVSERRQRPHGPGLARDERAPVPRLVPVQGWRPAEEGSPAQS